MRHRYRMIVVALATIMLLPACTSAQPQSSLRDKVCNGTECTSLDKFSQIVSTDLDGRVVGYVAIVGPHTVAHGEARTATNPPRRAMSADVPISVASIGKMFTTIAAIKLLDQHGLSIDTTILPYLPSDWDKGPGIETITFRELLTHRAGFRDDSGSIFSNNDAARQQIKNGIQTADKDATKYNNLNFAIFRELLPALAGMADPGPPQRTAVYGQFFKETISRQVYSPLGITDATCETAPATPPAAIYPVIPRGMVTPVPSNLQGAEIPSPLVACAASGWVMRPRDLYLFAADLANGDRLLTSRQKQLMNDNCLGWDCSITSQSDYRGKSGGFGIENAALATFVGIFRGKIPVVLVMNSFPPAPPSEVAYNSFRFATTR